MPKEENLKSIANFLYEAGMLAKTPRSGFQFLGSGNQSVAEHTNRAVFISYVLAWMHGNKVDLDKVLKMSLFHDFAEARVSDLNYVHQKYTERHEDKAVEDMVSTVPFGDDIKEILDEYEERQSIESKIAKDADNIEWIIALKEQADIGNERALVWIPPAVKRLKTEEAKRLVDVILKTDSDEWWFGEKDDSWWVNRNKKQ